MDNPAEVFADGPVTRRRSDVTFPPPAHEGIGWGIFIAQLVTVAVLYVVASAIPTIPIAFAQLETGATTPPEIPSDVALVSVTLSMALTLLLCWVWLRREGRVGAAWDLRAPPNWGKALAWAAAVTIGIFAIFSLGGMLMEALGLGVPDASEVFGYLTESPLMFWLWIIGVAVLAAGIGEELLYRGFLMDRLSRLAGLRDKVWLVLIIQAVLFGLPHAYQGLGGVVVTGSVGLLLGWVRLMQRGNLWVCILAHIAVDVIAMSLAYGETLGWFSA